jgi:diguanylate cyclase (GGDEF)-like protein
MYVMPRGLRWGLGILTALAVVQIEIPLGPVATAISYSGIALSAVALAALALVRSRLEHPGGWRLIVAGFALWVAADICWYVEQLVFHVQYYPVPSDGLYLSSYLMVGAGIVVLIRTQRADDWLDGALDVMIIATGCLIFVASALVVPLLADDYLTTFGLVVTGAYPVVGVLMLVIASQLWVPGARSWSFLLLMTALLLNFVPDVLWTAVAMASGRTVPSSVNDAAYLLSKVLLAAAVCHPSMRSMAAPLTQHASSWASRPRLGLLAVGLLTPAGVLAIGESGDAGVGVPVIGLAAVLLSVLTLARMGKLLGVIEHQSDQLSSLADRDDLTGAPNRRHWRRIYAAACADAAESGEPLTVALLDLDKFKNFNDSFGHQAGDMLLCDAVTEWTRVLGDRGTLGRYGGEEFVIALPGYDVDRALDILFELREVTPGSQTFSAGASRFEPSTDPMLAIQLADRGLYNAKHAGRDRIFAFPSPQTSTWPALPAPTMVVQPIVDLITGRVAAYEALARFDRRPPSAMFRLASDDGYGDLLEGRAIVEALALPDRPDLPLHVNASAGAMRSERFWALLPDDLSGVVVEISEHYDDSELSQLLKAVTRLRARGAGIATDDLGRGNHELLRLAAIRPDVVKVDRVLVEGCADDVGRQAALRGGLEFARTIGGELYTEGAVGIRDLHQLRAIGVRYAQCFALGRPEATWTSAYVELPFPEHRSLRDRATVD